MLRPVARSAVDNLNRFMSQQCLPQQMRQQLREYFHQTRHLQIARANKLLIENMSPMLQGLVVWKVNEKWLRHVWFLRSAEDSFMVQLSLHLTAAVFAPAELCPHGYMYIVHRGICLYGGKVLTSGKVWGEDMILKSPHLRSNYAARCMTYVEVYMIGRDDLIALAMRYPATLKLIRRSAFRLGFRREMIRRAQDSIKRANEQAGIKNQESVANKMLISVRRQPAKTPPAPPASLTLPPEPSGSLSEQQRPSGRTPTTHPPPTVVCPLAGVVAQARRGGEKCGVGRACLTRRCDELRRGRGGSAPQGDRPLGVAWQWRGA